MKYKHILITGGAGFVGSNLGRFLKNDFKELRITALDNLKRRGSELNLPFFKECNIRFIHGDIRNKEDLEQVGSVDCIIECSAEPSALAGYNESPDYLINTNLMGTINCLELARRYESDFFFLSTSRVYPIEKVNELEVIETETRFELSQSQSIDGATANGISEDFSLKGARTLYGSSKLCSEIMIEEYRNTYGLKGVINRCGVLTGPGQMGKVDQGFMVLWVANHFFSKKLAYIGFNGSGKQVRDILHVKDLYSLLKIQLWDAHKFDGEIFNVGGGQANTISLLELSSICREITGNNITIGSVKNDRPGDLKTFVTDSSKISALTGWKPETNVDQTVKDIYQWIKENETSLSGIFCE